MDTSNSSTLLEIVLTKLKYFEALRSQNSNDDLAEASKSINSKKWMKTFKSKVQVIAMSATLPNLHEIASWLNSYIFITNYRPVEVKEYVKIGDDVYDVKIRK